ncbi:MAG: segregation/condensation protein A [Calditrichia bacterium]
MSIKIKLENFEGPFDLLLYLVRKNELDIWDIPISEITRQYLEYIHLMQMLDLEIAGEFIEMVAYLILIKTRMLLPSEQMEDEEGEPEDPRKELALQLLEYARFKDVSNHFEVYENNNYYQLPHIPPDIKIEADPDKDVEISLHSITFFDLLTAFQSALKNKPVMVQHEITKIKVTTEEQSRYILKKLHRKKGPILFKELFQHKPEKIVLIVTFLSILDLMRLNLISVNQTQPYHDFQIVPQTESPLEKYEEILKQRIGERDGKPIEE